MVITLEDLPKAEGIKEGFPWTCGSQSSFLADNLPKISIVVPSFNQSKYLEETIRSILLQNYEPLELIIIDGGSTDGSVELIRKYEKFLAYWVSEPDRGQSHAINKGFEKATGDLIGWQNSDDFYLSNCFQRVARTYMLDMAADVFYGDWNTAGETSQVEMCLTAPSEFSPDLMPPYTCITSQATFYSKSIFAAGQYIREDLVVCMDVEFFWRLALAKYRFMHVAETLGTIRLYADTKTAKMTARRSEELFDIYQPLITSTVVSEQCRRGLIDVLQNCLRTDYVAERREAFLQHAAILGKMTRLPADLCLKVALAKMGPYPMVLSSSVKRHLRF